MSCLVSCKMFFVDKLFATFALILASRGIHFMECQSAERRVEAGVVAGVCIALGSDNEDSNLEIQKGLLQVRAR
jgi:hypothetical protein